MVAADAVLEPVLPWSYSQNLAVHFLPCVCVVECLTSVLGLWLLAWSTPFVRQDPVSRVVPWGGAPSPPRALAPSVQANLKLRSKPPATVPSSTAAAVTPGTPRAAEQVRGGAGGRAAAPAAASAGVASMSKAAAASTWSPMPLTRVLPHAGGVIGTVKVPQLIQVTPKRQRRGANRSASEMSYVQ